MIIQKGDATLIPTTELKPRINHPVRVYPDALQALLGLGKVAHNSGVPIKTLMMVELRASQINGCVFVWICIAAS